MSGLSEIESLYYFYGVEQTEAQLDRAEALAECALVLDPDLPETHVAIANVHLNRGDHGRAIESYREAVDRDPNNAYIWCQLGTVCLMADPTDVAGIEMAARESIRSQPGYYI